MNSDSKLKFKDRDKKGEKLLYGNLKTNRSHKINQFLCQISRVGILKKKRFLPKSIAQLQAGLVAPAFVLHFLCIVFKYKKETVNNTFLLLLYYS